MGKVKKLSIVIPCYNEQATIKKILEEIDQAKLGSTKKEIIIVDDGSKDGSRQILKKLADADKSIKLIFQRLIKVKGQP